MLDELKAVDTGKHSITIKHQLFKQAGQNIPLDKTIFDLAYVYAQQLGYPTTSSVFDKESLEFLLQFDVPMVKIANRRDLDWLIGEVPRKIPVYISCSSYGEEETLWNEKLSPQDRCLSCISKYPATLQEYEKSHHSFYSISDHTTNFDLWNKAKPELIEWHYVLEHDVNNLDGGLFARTPTMLAEIL